MLSHSLKRGAMTWAVVALTVASPSLALAQTTTPVTRANWKLADKFTAESLRPYMYSMTLNPGWVNKTSSFWYTWRDSNGVKFILVDPVKKKKQPLFDTAEMAMMLSEELKRPIDATNLPITTITFDEKNAYLIKFTVDNTRFEYNLMLKELKNVGKVPQTPNQPNPNAFKNEAPDKSGYVYAQDHNLYYVEVVKEKDKDGKEVAKDQPPIQLTKDGAKDYSFGSRPDPEELRQMLGGAGGQQAQQSRDPRVRANAVWSKDSKRFWITRGDQRKVKDLWLVNNLASPRPTLMTYKWPMPGEPDVPLTEVFVFEKEKKELKKLPIEKYKDQVLFNIHFPENNSDLLRLVRRDRLQRNLEMVQVDLKTDKVAPLLSESVENAYLEVQNVDYVKPGGDFIWWSERNGWGHLYLYSNEGKLKNAITRGAFRVEDVVKVDGDKGLVWFRAVGREPGENAYFRHLYRCSLDGKNLTLLDSGDADHQSTLSEDKKFIVDLSSRFDTAPVASLRDGDGKVVMELEKADLTRLLEFGWRMPEMFKVKAADGVTDIYGNMWKPSDFDATKRYPIIAYVYPGPQTESVTSTFTAAANNARLAQLGFIVIQIGNRGGTPSRSNAYHSYGYYNLRDYGLADKKAGIEQLAARYPWIDIDRVGIFGHSGGGFMTAAALLLPPYNDFFKVGVSSSGNHDNNIYHYNWSEQHHGMKEVPVGQTTTGAGGATGGAGRRGGRGGDPDEEGAELLGLGDPEPQQQGTAAGATKFDIKVPTTVELASNLKGKLMLVTGDMDNNVHPAQTIRLVDALIKANKRFDFMVMPGQAHGYGPMQPYFTNMMMEYFAEHLLGDNYRRSADMNERK